MRDIKFRGKSVKTGEWVHGYYCFGNRKVSGEKQHEIMRVNIAGCWGTEVDPATVGQFTGLVDKNGVEIYEGDVLLHHHQYKDWQSPPVEWKVIDCEPYEGVGFEISPECVEDANVIGNVHDNPELIEGESDV